MFKDIEVNQPYFDKYFLCISDDSPQKILDIYTNTEEYPKPDPKGFYRNIFNEILEFLKNKDVELTYVIEVWEFPVITDQIIIYSDRKDYYPTGRFLIANKQTVNLLITSIVSIYKDKGLNLVTTKLQYEDIDSIPIINREIFSKLTEILTEDRNFLNVKN